MVIYLLAVLWAGAVGQPVHYCDMRGTGREAVFIDRTPRRDDGSLSLTVRLKGDVVVGIKVSAKAALPDGCPDGGIHDVVAPRVRS